LGQQNYRLNINCADKNCDSLVKALHFDQNFKGYPACRDYTDKILPLLQSKGYVTASIDSLRFDSTSATLSLFVGDLYQWRSLSTKKTDPAVLESIGWDEKQFSGSITDINLIQQSQEKILTYYENHGYPFAKVYFDSIQIDEGNITAQLKADKGGLYKIDSIRIFGSEKISNPFMQRYLEIPNGSVYNKQKLKNISTRIQQLDYIEEEQPFDITYLATGAVVNLYVKNRKRNRINVLIGVLPNNTQLSSQKTLITGEGRY
jgi:outer membrane protein assembly factor BamA